MTTSIDHAELRAHLQQACDWLIDVAQVKSETPLPNETRRHHHRVWTGSFRGEYSAGYQQWKFFCPVWHGGQAIKALVMAHRVLGDARLMEAALRAAQFIDAQRVTDPAGDDRGLILAYEDHIDKVNTSAILEALDGLFALSDHVADARYQTWAIDALDWVARKAYVGGPKGEGLFHDNYEPATGRFLEVYKPAHGGEHLGRPLLDDAVFFTGFERTGNTRFRELFLATAERLLQEEQPAGNWIMYVPCNAVVGNIHPRHAYWWGRPMLAAWRATGDARFRDCALRSATWYQKALRRDGGLIRNTYTDFSTDSFGHATSGAACAAIFFDDVRRVLGDEQFEDARRLALSFCQRMQLRQTTDPNLRGVILEKVLPPDGTDRSPYHVRDLGTIFFIQAAALELGAAGKR